LTKKIKELHAKGLIVDASSTTDDQRALAVGTVREEYLAALMLSGANRDRFSLLRTDLQNQYGYGNDLYPKSTDQCLSLLNHWTVAPSRPKRGKASPNPSPQKQEEAEALVFAQDSSKRGPHKPRVDDSSTKESSSKGTSRPSSSSSSSTSSRKITNVH
jgi:hypothetical protein